MPHGLTVRSTITTLVLSAAVALALGATGCGREKTEPARPAPRPSGSPSNVRIQSYTKAPNVELKALDGSSSYLSDFQGKVVVLGFLATWNKDCAAQVAELNKLQAKLQRYRFIVAGVFTDKEGAEAVRPFIEKNPATFRVFHNGDEIVADFGGIRRIPTTYVLLRDGSIYTRELGFRTMRQLETFTRQINAQRL